MAGTEFTWIYVNDGSRQAIGTISWEQRKLEKLKILKNLSLKNCLCKKGCEKNNLISWE